MQAQGYRNKFLFIDNAHIMEIDNLQRTVNQAVKHPEAIMRLDSPWDQETNSLGHINVLYDEQEGIFKMWYCVSHYAGEAHDGTSRLAYATSTDGIHWEKPIMNLVEVNGSTENNYILPNISVCPAIIIDPSDIPERRYKMIFYLAGMEMTWAGFHIPLNLAYSANGIHWHRPVHVNPVLRGISDSCFSLIYDIDRRKYILFTRRVPNLPRDISLYESYDLVNWEDMGRVLVGGDEHDPAEMYNFYYMAPFRYDKFFLSMLSTQYTSPISESYDSYNRPPDYPDTMLGKVDIQLTYSRDGRTWSRPPVEARAVVPCGPQGSLDSEAVYPAQNPIVKDGQTWIYYHTQLNRHSWWDIWEKWEHTKSSRERSFGMLATMPEDHWISLDAGSKSGSLLTKAMSVNLTGEILINADARGGTVEAELITPFGQIVEGFGRRDCIAITSDGKDQPLRWNNGGKVIDMTKEHRGGLCFKFYLKNAKLYSFTVIEPDDERKLAQYWANARWCEVIKHKSDNWDRLSTEMAKGLPPHGGPGPERGQEKPGEMVVE